jgi:hypothetical protein
MGYLTTEEVCGKLAAAGVDEVQVGRIFTARLQPDGVDPDTKLALAVKTPDGQVYFALAQFGTGRPLIKNTPLDEGGPDWRPRWISVEGPFTLEEAPAKSKELTSAS